MTTIGLKLILLVDGEEFNVIDEPGQESFIDHFHQTYRGDSMGCLYHILELCKTTNREVQDTTAQLLMLACDHLDDDNSGV
jgi:acyl carrier protein